MSLREATEGTPWSNGTERMAWADKWCDYCAIDHDMTHAGASGNDGCPLLLDFDCFAGSDDWQWPEAWLPEPDDGKFSMPSRLVCTMFKPCEPCGGDPGAEERAQRIADVAAYWKANA